MEPSAWVGAVIFIVGYTLIAFEHKVSTHKSAIALVMGASLWILVACNLGASSSKLAHALESTSSQIFNIVAFLLAAMALIEILVHYRLFDIIRVRLAKLRISDRQQFLVLMVITFFFSAILDNIAITIAMLQVARQFFTGKNLLVAAAGIIIAANAGGTWSPIGDVTTILLWLNGKFTATQVITAAFIPALVLFAVSISLLYRKLDNKGFTRKRTGSMDPAPSEKVIIASALTSFLLPLAVSVVGLPPYIGLLLGLGITWGIIEWVKRKNPQAIQTHATANIEKLVQTVDIASIKYIIGILLSVSALVTLGILSALSTNVLGPNPGIGQLIAANIGLGLVSAILDNTSLVAMAIGTFPAASPAIWSLTALAVGTGGSIVIIASAAGVVTMGSVKSLTFQRYLRIASVPAAVGFAAGIATWLVQYQLFAK